MKTADFKNHAVKTTVNVILLLIFIIGYVPQGFSAQFEDLGVGARGTGLNNAFTALADDAYSVYYNPAGLARIKWKEFALDYEKLYWGLDDNSNIGNGFFSYAHSFNTLGTIGIGWLNFTLSNYYSENTFMLAYGKQILYSEESLPGFIRPVFSHFGDGSLKMGLKLKMLSKSFTRTLYTENATNLDTGILRQGRDPVFDNGYSKQNFSLDLGLLYDFDSYNSIGMAVNDVNQPDMGLVSVDKIPSEIKFGYAYRGSKVNMDADVILKQENYTFCTGVEKWFMDKTFAVRSGLGVGSGEYANLSFGGSYRYNEISQLDYSFRYPLRGVSSFYGSHQLSFTLKFGAKLTKKANLGK